ncbi:unnamed protein product, partial [Mesorhabditis belari]|uniref:Uncharacterized protein n=1 Tax=Mesorhabditis belari TaxID=2138241 RepID=A0AAF3FJQ6_9BILA
MGEANVFNTFSFNKWAEQKKEEEIDKETKRRRHEQIKRLKEKLRKERALREAGMGDGDLDLEALILAIQNANYQDVDETETTEMKSDSTTNENDPRAAYRGDPTSDAYILQEVMKYANDHPDGGDFRKGRPQTAQKPPDFERFNYNRRYADLESQRAKTPERTRTPPPPRSYQERPRSQVRPASRRPSSSLGNQMFQYNRKVSEVTPSNEYTNNGYRNEKYY